MTNKYIIITNGSAKLAFKIIKETKDYITTCESFSQGILSLSPKYRSKKLVRWNRFKGFREGDTEGTHISIVKYTSDIEDFKGLIYDSVGV